MTTQTHQQQSELGGSIEQPDEFEIICRFKDSNSSNLNKVFESYGCSTLEAKVPVVRDVVLSKLESVSVEEKLYATLAMKSESANNAMEGRASRTRNRPLKLVEINGETILEAGKTRERTPVDKGELDDDIDQYMKERARLKMSNVDLNSVVKVEPTKVVTKIEKNYHYSLERRLSTRIKPDKDENLSNEILDDDIDSYMKEAARLKAQKKVLDEQSGRMDVMMEMEQFEEGDDFDNNDFDNNDF